MVISGDIVKESVQAFTPDLGIGRRKTCTQGRVEFSTQDAVYQTMSKSQGGQKNADQKV
jgi:hypothetical protein